eukprot:IDg10521t1
MIGTLATCRLPVLLSTLPMIYYILIPQAVSPKLSDLGPIGVHAREERSARGGQRERAFFETRVATAGTARLLRGTGPGPALSRVVPPNASALLHAAICSAARECNETSKSGHYAVCC